MSTSPILGTLLGKKLGFVEETVFGQVPAGSPFYAQIGYDSPVQISAPTNLAPVLQPGSEDPQVLQERRIDEYLIDFTYRPFDTLFAKYGFNAQGGGAGTIDKSVTMVMSAMLNATTETFIQPVGCRIDRLTIGGKAGGPITVKVKVLSQNIPVPTVAQPAGSFSNPSGTPFLFKEGGAQPITIAGTSYNVNLFSVTASRNIDKIPQPDSDLAQALIPTMRKITGTVAIVWTSLDNYTRLRNDQSYTLIWTIRSGVSTMTLTGCRFKALESLRFTPTQTVYETYSFESTSGVLT